MTFVLVIWDGSIPRVLTNEDESDAIEMVKELKPFHDAVYLYQANRGGAIDPIDTSGW